MTMAILMKENISLGLGYMLRGLVHYHQGRKHADMRAETVLEKELRVLHQDQQAAWLELPRL